MNFKKFYRSEHTSNRGEGIASNNSTKDVFVTFPISIKSKLQTKYTTLPIRSSNIGEIDDRIKHISSMAEKKYVEQRRREIEHIEELHRKRKRDAVLIPHIVNSIKKQNFLNMQTHFYKTPLKIHNNRHHINTYCQRHQSIEPKNSLPLTRTYDNSTEKYLDYTHGVPLTRDFVIPNRTFVSSETKKGKKLRIYSEPRKTMTKNTTKRDHFIHKKLDPKIIERSKEERIAQLCARLVSNAKYKLTRGQLQSAFEELQEAVNEGIKHADVFYMLGEVNRLLKNYKESVKYLLEAMRFKLHSPYTYYSLGRSYSSLGEHDKAVQMIEHFLELIEIPEAHYDVAKALSELQDNTASLIHLTRAIELDPNCAQYYAFRAEIYEYQRFLELANKDYKKTLEIEPKFLDKYYNQCKILENTGNYLMATRLKEFINKFLNAL